MGSFLMLKIQRFSLIFLSLMFLVVLHGCYPALEKRAEKPEEALTRIRFFYPKFADDSNFSSLAPAIEQSLEYLKRLDPKRRFHYGPHVYSARHVRDSLKTFSDLISRNPDPGRLKKEIKKHFLVYRARGRAGDNRVLFTGYFEPVYQGSLVPDESHSYPLYKKPDDLIKIDLSRFRKEFKGKSIIARIDGQRVIPYFTRKQIETEKALSGRQLEVAWLKDPLDVAFLHIQGSGRLKLPDGQTIRVGYAASNGRPYMSIGRYMIEKGYLKREEVSMQSIRRYLSGNPDIMTRVLNYNPSYVFFRTLKDGPLGNISVPLTPERSLALDYRLFPKGALCFIKTKKPVVNKKGEITGWVPFSRFVLNQDTGGAIRGAGRADLFWGSGGYAELAAGHMKHHGEVYVLIKKPK
ncbi:MAG: MltA domain-containing protein [Deltaproteobacteria bacterium]|nr:MltA domain-containing protein [Deltaproteobacteria bacterium]